MFKTPRAVFDVSNWDWGPSVVLANFNYLSSQVRAKSKLKAPTIVLPALIFDPIKVKLAPSHRLSRRIKSQFIKRPLDIRDRYEIPVHNIDRMLITNPPPAYFSDSNIGFFFNNIGGDVYLEVFSSTISQSFTIQTEKIIDYEWHLEDVVYFVSNADTKYFIGPFPERIYDQPNTTNVFVDHAVDAVLQFRAWRMS